jgi:fatty-acyl-CoA synthase
MATLTSTPLRPDDDHRWAAEILRSMAARGRQVAFRDVAEERTHGESRARVIALTRALVDRGLGPGDRVALVVESTADAVEAYLAVNLCGATAVQVNDRLQIAEVEEILGVVSPRALIHTGAHGARLDELLAGAGLEVVSIGGAIGCTTVDVDRMDVVPGAAVPSVAVDPAAPSIIGFTSGTTGRPKGVVHSHRNIGAIVRHMPTHDGFGWGSRCAMTGTLAFAAGIWGVVLPHLYVGGEISWMAGLPADQWVDRMVREHSTFTYAPTPLFGAFADAVRDRPEVLDHLEVVLHSGSAATREATESLVDVVGGRFTETYGMTETGAPVTTTGPDDWAPWSEAEDIYASAGRVIPLARIQAVGEDGVELPPGEVGDLVVDSPFLFDGYWNDPQETAAALRDGQMFTGDRGRLDEAGYVYVSGRSKDMIVSGGMNVYPAEVERVLAQAPGVIDVAVFGVAHERWGETVVAAVVGRPGETIDVDGVLAYARERLAGYKKPTTVHVLDELPRNANLKVRKDVLRDRFEPPQT